RTARCSRRAAGRRLAAAGRIVGTVLAVDRTFPERVKCLPCDAFGVVHPCLVRLGIATRRGLLLVDGLAGSSEPFGQRGELRVIIDLDAEMIDPFLPVTTGDREIHARVL